MIAVIVIALLTVLTQFTDSDQGRPLDANAAMRETSSTSADAQELMLNDAMILELLSQWRCKRSCR